MKMLMVIRTKPTKLWICILYCKGIQISNKDIIKTKSTQGNTLKEYDLKPLFFLMGPPMIGILYALVSLTRSQEA